MSRRVWAVAAIVIVTGLLMPPPARAGSSGKVCASRKLLEARIEALEEQNRILRQQGRAIQNQLSEQKSEIEALKKRPPVAPQSIATLPHELPRFTSELAGIAEDQSDLPFELGFRVGWSETPYKMPGGFFYGAYFNHRLLTNEDGVAGGFVSGELMAGAVLGDKGQSGSNRAFLDTLEIQPTVQYHLDPALLGKGWPSAIRPYLLAGPGMWINLLSAPIVAGSLASAGFRRYNVDFQGGGIFGLGAGVSLSALKAPAVQRILDKSFLGAEWRYNQFGNGQSFQQYAGSIGLGW
jgi:hypothetical protein